MEDEGWRRESVCGDLFDATRRASVKSWLLKLRSASVTSGLTLLKSFDFHPTEPRLLIDLYNSTVVVEFQRQCIRSPS